MNTSLKNARIFDDNSWDDIDGSPNGLDDTFGIIDEVNSETEDDNNGDTGKTNFPTSKETFVNFAIKPEISLSPMKIDDDNSTNKNNDSNSRRSFKSAKKTSFKHKLDSPYKRTDVSETKQTVAFNLDKNNDKTGNCLKRSTKRKEKELETDPEILARRQKQIDYGKNTIAYDAYRKAILKYSINYQPEERKLGDPETPDKYHKYSRRAWDGLIKKWRLLLHKYDPVPLIKKF